MRRRFPILLGLLFISVTIRRIADFSGSDALAWTFALGLAISVFAMAYYSRFAKTQTSALVTLAFLVVVDGMFNLSEVLKWSVSTGRWSFSVQLWREQEWYIYRAADFVYGLFPTAAAMLLGWVAGHAAQIPLGTARGNFRQRALAWLADTLFGEEGDTAEQEPAPEPVQPEQITASADDEPVRDRAFAELNRNPKLSGAALAAQVGITAGYGRKLKRDWTAMHGNGSGHIPEREEQEA
jgi:hypothetical protein